MGKVYATIVMRSIPLMLHLANKTFSKFRQMVLWIIWREKPIKQYSGAHLRDEILIAKGWNNMQVNFRFNCLIGSTSYRFNFLGNNNITRHFCLVYKVGM